MFTIKCGIHKHTLDSSRVSNPRQFNTKDEAITWYKSEKRWLQNQGYVFWFCHLTGPDGQQEMLEQNQYV